MSSAARSREASSASRIRVAYLVNQYPKISHTFIRREILALEAQGVEVTRIAIRGHETAAVDASDAEGAGQDQVSPRGEPARIVAACLSAFLALPARSSRRWSGRCGSGAVRRRRDQARRLLRRGLHPQEVAGRRAGCGTSTRTSAPTRPRWRCCRLLGGPPYSFTVHGPDEFDRPLRLALPKRCEGAASVCVISSFGRSQLYRWTTLADWMKIHVVRCGVEPSFFAAGPAIADRPRLVCVGG